MLDVLLPHVRAQQFGAIEGAGRVGVGQEADELLAAVACDQIASRFSADLSAAATRRRQSSPAWCP